MALYSEYSKSASWIYYNIKKLKTNVQQQISKRVWKKQQTETKLDSFIYNIITGYLNKQVNFYTSFSFSIKFHVYNLHYEQFQDGTVKCIEDDITFEIPESWAWERLGNISLIARGGSPRPIKSYLTNDKNGINWIKIGDTEIDGKYIYSTKEKIKPQGA